MSRAEEGRDTIYRRLTRSTGAPVRGDIPPQAGSQAGEVAPHAVWARLQENPSKFLRSLIHAVETGVGVGGVGVSFAGSFPAYSHFRQTCPERAHSGNSVRSLWARVFPLRVERQFVEKQTCFGEQRYSYPRIRRGLLFLRLFFLFGTVRTHGSISPFKRRPHPVQQLKRMYSTEL